MYNRYIPQPDGTFRKNRISDPPQPPASHPQPQEHPSTPQEGPQYIQPQPTISFLGGSAGSFLKRLLPKNLDTGDLLVMVLLLLMAGESEKEKSNALLTLALYLLM